ncbi:hypothetical protein FYJ24_00630 [Actinomycetaceae bacterium WB03_NA08]|uniref:Uncharacterized protein n=1 Tax=Scrofimicrobium canadense TaxID=2652290 RepID=A0A6N7W453_9ACTO|nr:hypothetical protein [Scrofimicrobium canadense]MSS83293.1 hypothetical protein [Scrofimicrobium canadense]
MRNAIWVQDGPGDQVALVCQIAEIAAATVVKDADGPPPGTVLAIIFDEQDVSVPAIRLGDGGDMRLPQDASLLAQAMISAAQDFLAPEGIRVLVAGWHGGAGTSLSSKNLAAAGRACLIEASRSPQGDEGVPIVWARVNAKDPPIVGQYRAPRNRPIVASGPGDCVGHEDSRVLAVSRAARGHAVVDCGVWTPGVEELAHALDEVRIVLVGHARQYARLFGILDVAAFQPRVILTDRPGRPEMMWAAERSGAILRAPRRWKRLWKELLHD